MSSSRSSRLAYKVYSSSSSKSKQKDKHSDKGESSSHQRRTSKSSQSRSGKEESSRKVRAQSYDSDDEVLKVHTPASKSLLSLQDQSSSKSQDDCATESHHEKTDKHRQNAPSLMDIDFETGGSNREAEYSRGNCTDGSDDEDNDNHRSSWKRRSDGQRYSDSSEERGRDNGQHSNKSSKGRREWKDCSPEHSSSRHPEPLIVDTLQSNYRKDDERKSSETDHVPRSLMDSYITPMNKKPLSLLDFATGGRTRPRNKSHDAPGKRQRDSHPERSKKSVQRCPSSGYEDETCDNPVKKTKSSKPEGEHKKHLFGVHSNSNRLSVYCNEHYTVLAIPATILTLGLHGRVRVISVMGSVSVLGCRLRTGRPYDLYSPLTGGLLSMYVLEDANFEASKVKEELTKFTFSESDINLEGLSDNTVAVLLLEKLESVMCDYISTFIPYTQLFNSLPSRDESHMQSSSRGVTLTKLGLKMAPPEEMTPLCLNMSQEYQDVMDSWTKMITDDSNKVPILLLCGAKYSGKSTFNRMLINSSLQSVDAIAYLECDVGQTEFSPPATLAVHIIREPILGPPFCHQKHAERMVFYGDVSPTTDPTLYVKCLRYIFGAYKVMFPSVPLIVNTMGFPEGLGLMLLIDTVNIVTPDLVVQIDSFNQAANLPAITHEMVALHEGWTLNKTPVQDSKEKMAETQSHDLMILISLISKRRDFSVKLKPVDLRNLSLLASLSLGLEHGITLSSMPPYVVPYSQLGVHVCHHMVKPSEILEAIDASVVALCVADLTHCQRPEKNLPFVFKEMPVCKCLGLGIVRGVDTVQGVLYIVTTLPKQYLSTMNTIMKGSLVLPEQLILKQKSVNALPYVDALAPSTAVRPRMTLGINK